MKPLDRKLKILRAVVEKYILTGEPVGSKSISESYNMPFSSATIRNEMADLVDCGYLIQPHISAGRMPSYRGYRLYLNKLMNIKPLESEIKNFINGALSSASLDPESLIDTATKVLADITGFTSVVTTPINQKSRIKNIKFLQTGKRSAMIVLITSSGMIKNKLFRCDYNLNTEILNMLEKILEQKFCGKVLSEIQNGGVDIIVGSDEELALLLLPIIDVLLDTIREAREIKIKIHGRKNLLFIPGITNETVINIFNFLENNTKVLDLLDCSERGINFIVGEENNYRELQNASLVSSKYHIDDKFGIMGIIGPTRMDYSLISSQLQYVSSLIEIFLQRMTET